MTRHLRLVQTLDRRTGPSTLRLLSGSWDSMKLINEICLILLVSRCAQHLGAGHGQTVGNADESFTTQGRIGYWHRAWDRGPHTAALETQPFGLVTFSMFGSGAYGPQGALGKKKPQCPVSSTDGRRGRGARAGFPLRAGCATASGRLGCVSVPHPTLHGLLGVSGYGSIGSRWTASPMSGPPLPPLPTKDCSRTQASRTIDVFKKKTQ